MALNPCRSLLSLLGEVAPGPPRAVVLSEDPKVIFRALEAFPAPLASAPIGRGTLLFKPILWLGKPLPAAEALVADEREGFPCVSGRVFSVENLGALPDGVLFKLGRVWGLAGRKKFLKSGAHASAEACAEALALLERALERGFELAEEIGKRFELAPGWGALRLKGGEIWQEPLLEFWKGLLEPRQN